jgi:y4mF family transcriptional regulator
VLLNGIIMADLKDTHLIAPLRDHNNQNGSSLDQKTPSGIKTLENLIREPYDPAREHKMDQNSDPHSPTTGFAETAKQQFQYSMPNPMSRIATAADIGRLIKAARQQRQLSQQDFADLAGVGRRFISELENGKATLEFDKVLQVAASVGIDLFAREGRSHV